MVVTLGQSGPIFKAPDRADAPEVTVAQFAVVTSPTTTYQTDGDLYLRKEVETSTPPAYQLGIVSQGEFEIEDLSGKFVVSGATVTAQAAQSGTGGVKITNIKSGAAVLRTLNAAPLASVTTYFVESLTADSLLAVLTDPVLTARDGNSNINYLSTINHNAPSYVRNAGCWASGFDLSSIAVAVRRAGVWSGQRGGALVTARHVVFAKHFGVSVGDAARWLTPGGTVVERTVIGVSHAAGSEGDGYSDLQVATFDSTVTGITPMEVMFDWRTSIDERGLDGGDFDLAFRWGFLGLTLAGTDKHAHPLLVEPTYLDGTIDAGTAGEFTNRILSCPRVTATINAAAVPFLAAAATTTQIAVGDSGSPIVAIINDLPVLVSAFFRNTSGPAYSGNADIIDAHIALADAAAGMSTGLTTTEATDPTA